MKFTMSKYKFNALVALGLLISYPTLSYSAEPSQFTNVNCTITLGNVDHVRAFQKDAPLAKIGGTVRSRITCSNPSFPLTMASPGDLLKVTFGYQEALTAECKGLAETIFNKADPDAVLNLYIQIQANTVVTVQQISHAPGQIDIEKAVPLSCAISQPQQ